MTAANDFDEIYSAHAAAVYHTCLRAVSLPDAAESLTSDVFASLYAERDGIADGPLDAWFDTRTRELAREYWKRQPRGRSWSGVEPGGTAAAQDAQFSLDRLLDQDSALKQVHRVCLILRFRHGMSRAVIASHTGMSELQVKGHLQQAMRLVANGSDVAESVDFETQLEAGGRPGLCPSPDLLFAAREDVLPDAMGVAVREHADRCALCQTLLEGLAPAAGELTPGQDARIHERLMAALQPEEFSAEFGYGRHPVWRMMGPVVVIVLLAVGSVTSYRMIHRSVEGRAPALAAKTRTAAVQDIPELRAVAPLAPPAGGGAVEPPASALEAAFRPYREGNFAAAAAALVPLAARYPKADTPLLYLGVAQLQLGENAAAETTLAHALAVAGYAHQADVAWYLGVAELRVGKTASAEARFQGLCSGASSHAARACALAAQRLGER